MRTIVKSGVYSDYVQNRIIQAQYYRDPKNEQGYLEKNRFLPDLNNENNENLTFKKNLKSLDKFIMIRFSEDVMIKPGYTAWFWLNDEEHQLIPLQNQTLYTEDWLGLKYLNEHGLKSLPITSTAIPTTFTTATSNTVSSTSISANPNDGSHNATTSKKEQDTNICPETDFQIPVERFAQLVSTHWQFDHLDSIKSGTYKTISEQFQKHISVSIEQKKDKSDQQQTSNNRQKTFRIISSWEMMDLEILHAQIFGAIQAHTEGSLHLAWDRLADKLGQPAFEAYIRTTALKYCGHEDTLLSSACLKQSATQLSLELDGYIQQNLIQVFNALDNDVLPQLLANTSKDLTDVLAYFNRLFSLGDNQQLELKVTPWTQQTDSLKSKLLPLLDKSTLNDEHSVDFFSEYACLSRA
ncbi:hypothetical protein [Parasitella parasitica]|uniref:Uncharacterized protein n=1 Tax=Parasitella parasitica TaxID=35722 RepID=A0A0B7N562_9FUNG|nr:hypothetical protein [Parasitella parasitica]